VIDNRDVVITGPEINYRAPKPGQSLDQLLNDELGLGVKRLSVDGKDAEGAHKMVYYDVKDPSILRKAFDPKNFGNADELANAVQRELANHLLMESRGISVAELDTSPAARALWGRGIVTYKRSPGRAADKVFGAGGYKPGRYPKLDGLLDDVERLKSCVFRNTAQTHCMVYMNKVPTIPRNGVEVKPVRFMNAKGKMVDGFLDPTTGKKMTADLLQPNHYSVVHENGLTLYNTPIGANVGYNLSNILVDEATGNVQLTDN
jgi:hypothetical protein